MMTTAATRRRRRPDGRRGAFTLLEMMVVVGLIAILAVMALPAVISMYNSGAEAQAYNLISAQIAASRARAITSSTYAGIHVQMADPTRDPQLRGVSYSGLIVYDAKEKYFDLVQGSTPSRVPGTMAVGYASLAVPPLAQASPGVSAGSLDATLTSGSSSEPFTGGSQGPPGGAKEVSLEKFTTFSVIFNPTGAVTRYAGNRPIHFNPSSSAFTRGMGTFVSTRLWKDLDTNVSQDRFGVTALVMFDLVEYEAASNRAQYLNENARILPLNIHTGQLYGRE